MTLAEPTEGHDRDHWVEHPSAWVAGVCDRGIRHAGNEDAMALTSLAEPGTFAALVVCDGVSSAPGSDLASLAAATAVRDVLAAAAADSWPGGDGADPRDAHGTAGDAALTARIVQWGDRFEAAARAAVAAITESGAPVDSATPAACTLAAATIDGPLLMVTWIGDSRVYWIPDAGAPRRLTVDDSWAQAMIDAGVPAEEAETAPNAHAITRWLGSDDTDHTPRCAPFVPAGPGWVLACSDGLWNYASDPETLAGIVRSAIAEVGQAPADVAARLVAWANEQGGHDNITAALARL